MPPLFWVGVIYLLLKRFPKFGRLQSRLFSWVYWGLDLGSGRSCWVELAKTGILRLIGSFWGFKLIHDPVKLGQEALILRENAFIFRKSVQIFFIRWLFSHLVPQSATSEAAPGVARAFEARFKLQNLLPGLLRPSLEGSRKLVELVEGWTHLKC
jgi:hypothetical protein